MCKCTGFVYSPSSQHVECLLRCYRAGCSNDLNNDTTVFCRFHKGSCWIMAENLRYIHPLRTRNCLAALLVSELIDEDKEVKKRRDKTRGWTWRRSSKGCYSNIELMIEDTAGYKEMMRMTHGNIIFLCAGHCKVWPVSNLAQDSTPLNISQQGVQMRSTCWTQHVESLYSGQIQCICTWPNR